jgi:hypothetical protein
LIYCIELHVCYCHTDCDGMKICYKNKHDIIFYFWQSFPSVLKSMHREVRKWSDNEVKPSVDTFITLHFYTAEVEVQTIRIFNIVVCVEIVQYNIHSNIIWGYFTEMDVSLYVR